MLPTCPVKWIQPLKKTDNFAAKVNRWKFGCFLMPRLPQIFGQFGFWILTYLPISLASFTAWIHDYEAFALPNLIYVNISGERWLRENKWLAYHLFHIGWRFGASTVGQWQLSTVVRIYELFEQNIVIKLNSCLVSFDAHALAYSCHEPVTKPQICKTV